jgi:trans-aconitate methyltransferase
MTAQAWNAAGYAKHARFVAELGAPVLELLAPNAGERILDLGCGDGVLTKQLVELACTVVGVDASSDLVAAARVLGLDARVGDGEALTFVEEFDAVFSNAALHWMKRPERVVDGVFRALRPKGRFVGEFGGAGCVGTIVRALEEALERRGIDGPARSPWYFPSAETYAELLESRGFVVKESRLFSRPTRLPTGVRGWLETFGHAYLDGMASEAQDDFIEEVERAVNPALIDANGAMIADYVRLRFAAEKP